MSASEMLIVWIHNANAAWYGAAAGGAAVAVLAEWRCRQRQPTDDDVLRAAELYRQFYGNAARKIIGDHMLAASFAPDGRHRRFLKRVSAELIRDRNQPISHATLRS